MNTKSFVTSDQVNLNYLEAGSGAPLVMLPGWSQTAEQYKLQMEELSAHYRCLALDMRGHGASDKPEHGYSVHRLAKDVHEFLTELRLENVTLLGWSMGCSIIWAYWELFGPERLAKLVLVDEIAFIASHPDFTSEVITELCNAIASPDAEAGEMARVNLVSSMLTPDCPAELTQWILACNAQLPLKHAATLLYNHCHQDWRSVIPRINLPTLVIGGRISLVPWRSMEWIANQIPNARLEIFEADEGGQHFLFLENPQKLNRLVTEFMGE